MITFKFIHQLKLPEIDKLLEIVGDQENMKEIGNGLTWDKHKIIDLMNYSNYDYKNKFKDSLFLFLVMFDGNKIVGIGYIHPGIYEFKKCCVQVAVLIDKKYRKRGYGNLLQKELLKMNDKYLHKPILSLVKIENKASNMLFKKYKMKGQILVNGHKYNVYQLQE